jgi:hypothetical protein
VKFFLGIPEEKWGRDILVIDVSAGRISLSPKTVAICYAQLLTTSLKTSLIQIISTFIAGLVITSKAGK